MAARSAPGVDDGIIQVDGDRLVLPDGSPIVLRGVAQHRWLHGIVRPGVLAEAMVGDFGTAFAGVIPDGAAQLAGSSALDRARPQRPAGAAGPAPGPYVPPRPAAGVLVAASSGRWPVRGCPPGGAGHARVIMPYSSVTTL